MTIRRMTPAAAEEETTMTDEEVLMTLIQGDDGRVWASQRLGWSLNEQPPIPKCDWYGITCSFTSNNDGDVIAIEIPESNFIGSIPSQLGQLSTLRTINVSQNMMRGTIPSQMVSSLSQLVYFDVSQNMISGSVPKFHSQALETIRLGDNMFSGSLPNNFGDGHVMLRELDVVRNQISGGLPSSMGQLESLSKLSLSENRFYGTLPEELGGLSTLQYLYIDLNEFMGTIPRSLTPQDSSLREVWLQGNHLSGTIPSAFATMDQLVNLYVDGNKFTGQLPDELCSKPQINSDFFAETDAPPKDGNGVDGGGGGLYERDVCDSIACPLGTVSREGVWPCEPCPPGTISPYLGKEVTCLPTNEETILRMFHEATNGGQWSEPHNWFQPGNVDKCDFTGIECNAEGRVRSIRLPNFGLKGVIPQEMGFLEHLEVFDVSNNSLEGYLPSDLRFAPLDVLDVTDNKMEGIIPPTLCLVGGVNDNGRGGTYHCDVIACPAGTYNALGRMEVGGGGEVSGCLPCDDGLPYVGRTTCGDAITFGRSGDGTNQPGTALLATLVLMCTIAVALAGYAVYVRRRRWKQMSGKGGNISKSLDDAPDLNSSDYMDQAATTSKAVWSVSTDDSDEYFVVEEERKDCDLLTDDEVSSTHREKRKKKKKRSKKRGSERRSGDKKKSSHRTYVNVPLQEMV